MGEKKSFRSDNPAFFPRMPKLLYTLGWARLLRAAHRAVREPEIRPTMHRHHQGARRKRVLLYGAGLPQERLERLVAFGRALKAVKPTANILVVADAEQVPQGQKEPTSSLLALPSYGGLHQPAEWQRDMRTDMLLAALYTFQPHVVVTADPGFGPHDEVLPALEYLAGLRSAPARFCLLPSPRLADIPHLHGHSAGASSLFDFLFTEADLDVASVRRDVPATFAARIRSAGATPPTGGAEGLDLGPGNPPLDPTLARAVLAARVCLARRKAWRRLPPKAFDATVDSLLDGICRQDDPEIFTETGAD